MLDMGEWNDHATAEDDPGLSGSMLSLRHLRQRSQYVISAPL